MRQRTSEYRPSPASISHSLSRGRSVRLFPFAALTACLTKGALEGRLLRALGESEDGEVYAAQVKLVERAISLYVLWDDPAVEWESTSIDPDELLNGTNEQLLEVGLGLSREVMSVATTRHFYLFNELLEAMLEAPTARGENSSPGE